MKTAYAFVSTFYFLLQLSATQKKIKRACKPTHRTLQTFNDRARNLECLRQSSCGLDAAHLQADSRAAANKGFAIAGVPCFADTFVQGGSSVLRMKFSANNPRHRKPPKRLQAGDKNVVKPV
jgi:hypothetical protein